MGKIRTEQRKERRGCLAFKYKNQLIFLPTVTITSDLRQLADQYLVKKDNVKDEEVKSWKPSRDEIDISAKGNPPTLDKLHIPKDNSETSLSKRYNDTIQENQTERQTSTNDSRIEGDKRKDCSAELLKQKRKALFKNLIESTKSESSGIQKRCEKCDKEYKAGESHVCNNNGSQINKTTFGGFFGTLNARKNSSQLKCTDCGKTFLKRIHLTLHQKIHASMDKPVLRTVSKTFLCNYCDSKFERNDDLLSHYQRQHNISNNFHVHQLKTGTNINYVQPDGFEKQADTDFECKDCNLTFSSASEFHYHSQFCKSQQQSNVPSAADKDEGSEIGFNNKLYEGSFLASGGHFLSEENDDSLEVNRSNDYNPVKPYPDETTTQVTNLEEKHTINLPYKCRNCDKQFKFEHYLKFHEKSHFQTCSKCNGQIRKEQYQDHLQSCNNSSISEISSSAESTSNINVKEDVTTSDDALLNRHKLVHKFCNVRNVDADPLNIQSALPFSCLDNTCQSRFSHHDDLQYHLKSKHPTQDFKYCDKCGQSFSTVFSLHRHWSSAHDLDRPRKPVRLKDDYNESAECQSKEQQYFMQTTYYYIEEGVCHKKPPNPYVLISQDMKSAADKSMSANSRLKIETNTEELISGRGNFRQDIPIRDVYKCKLCNKKFKIRLQFMVHLSQHKRMDRYKCHTCSRGFLSQKLLSEHIKRHDDPSYDPTIIKAGRRGRTDIPIQDEYFCDKCDQVFDERRPFLIHLWTHKKEEQYKCEICKRGFLSETLLQQHKRRHDDPNYGSGLSGRGRRTDIPIQSIYTCDICEKTFTQSQRKLFLLHLREHKYQCGACQRSFLSQAMLDQHVKRHEDPDYDPDKTGRLKRADIPIQSIYTCDICKKTFTQSQRNLFLLHLREHKYQCGTCKRSFLSQAMLDQHVKRHEDPDYDPDKTGRLKRADIPIQSVYKCEKCDKKFSQRRMFIYHLYEHRMWEKYTCQHCDRKFMTEATYNDHVERHSDPAYIPGLRGGRLPRTDIPEQDSYTCETCNKTYNERRNYLIHLNQHEREKKFTCHLCNRKHLSDTLLQAHLKRHEDPSYVPGQRGKGRFRTDIPVQNSYTCETCDRIFEERRAYLLHIYQHQNKKFKCSLCDKKFQSNFMLQLHIKRHDDPTYVPERERGGWKRRMDIPEQDSYTCETCNKIFDNRKNFMIHLSLHEREKRFTCSQCGRKFQSNLLFQAHLKRHEDPSYVPITRKRVHDDLPHQDIYHCEYCQKEFTERKFFIQHLWGHKREAKHGCHLCERKFFSQKLLHEHLRKHLNPAFRFRTISRKRRTEIPVQDEYACEKCDRIYTDRHNYLVHLYSHKKREERLEDLKCTLCNKSFLNKARFVNHMLQHSGSFDAAPINRPGRAGRLDIPFQDVYECEHCQDKKTFTDRQKYLVHIRYHTLDEKFECPNCPRRFKTKQMMDEHVDTHNKRKIYECQDCLKMFRTKQVRYLHQQKFCKKIPCKVQCQLCDDRFQNEILLQKHFTRVHVNTLDLGGESATADIEVPCPHCSLGFANSYQLHRHIAIYHPNTMDAEETQNSILNMLNDESKAVSDANHATCNDNQVEEDSRNVVVEESFNDQEEDDDDNEGLDMSDMLATDFLETEMTEEQPVSSPSSSSSVMKKRNKKISKSRNVCYCKDRVKYKSQKFCHNQTCPCVRKKKHCTKRCGCTEACLNNDDCEQDQQQIFKEGRENLILEQHTEESSNVENSIDDDTPEDDGITAPILITQQYSLASGGGQPSIIQPYPNNLISSEYISVDDNEQVTESNEPATNFIDESEEVDPLADPLVETSENEHLVDKAIISHLNTPPLSSSASISLASATITAPSTSVTSSSATITSTFGNPSKQLPDLDSDSTTTANLRCQFCKKHFKTVPSFICHFLVHGGEIATYNCPICNKVDTYLADFLQHMNDHNKGIDVQCTKCSSKFKTYKDVDKHMKVHHYKPLECGLCTEKFPSSHTMMSHWSSKHPTCQCGLCMVKFFSYDDLTFHMKSLHTPYDCVHCGSRFESLDPLLTHFLEVHYLELSTKKSNSRQIIDSTINNFVAVRSSSSASAATTPTAAATSTNRPSSSQSHQSSLKARSKFKCDCCGFMFSNIDQLNYHLATQLSKSHPANQGSNRAKPRCDQCGQTFDDVESLHEHLSQHVMGTLSRVTLAPVVSGQIILAAPVTFSTAVNNTSNISTTSSNNVVYVSYQNPSMEILQQQEENDNTMNPQEVFTCPVCNKSCSSKPGLLLHLRCHRSIIFCSACISVFNSRDELMQHLSPIGGKAACVIFECHECLRNYNSKATLSQHIKVVHDKPQQQSQSNNYSSSNNVILDEEEEPEDSVPIIVASTSLAPPPQVIEEVILD